MVPRPRRPEHRPDHFHSALLAAAASIDRPLSVGEAGALTTHFRLLGEWSRRMNLTGLKDQESILRRHFLEPIAAADLLENGGRLIDLGSGNGFPAIPLKVLRPDLDLILVESSEKKSAFLWAVLREIGLRGSRVLTRRVDSAADLSDLLPCRYLTFRAVRGQDLLQGEAGPVLEPGGKALLFLSDSDAEALGEAPIPGLRRTETRPLPSGPRSVVVVLEPVG